ncbi:MAG: sulfatase-like hydrolase/transferase, partial [Bacteroidales bacterium]|nr:sulfatase-like hydrolase/transferase [Bacteroidales bacterium]
IITGDHSGHGLTPEYNDYDGWYRIPMMVFDPQRPEGRRFSRIVQQTDLYPTLADWLGCNEDLVGFGSRVSRDSDGLGWQVYYGNGYHVLVTNNADTPSQHDITVIMGDYASGSKQNIRFLRALIQQYNNRLINNKLTLQ